MQRAAAVSTLKRESTLIGANSSRVWFSKNRMPVEADASMLTDDAGIVDGSRLRYGVKLRQPGIGNVVSQQGVRPGHGDD